MLNETCAVCGLPNELCVCGNVEKTGLVIQIKTERRKYGKLWVVITGIESDNDEMKVILKYIKNKLACGGTIKGKSIEILYGRNERTKELIDALVELGFERDSIHVTGIK